MEEQVLNSKGKPIDLAKQAKGIKKYEAKKAKAEAKKDVAQKIIEQVIALKQDLFDYIKFEKSVSPERRGVVLGQVREKLAEVQEASLAIDAAKEHYIDGKSTERYLLENDDDIMYHTSDDQARRLLRWYDVRITSLDIAESDIAAIEGAFKGIEARLAGGQAQQDKDAKFVVTTYKDYKEYLKRAESKTSWPSFSYGSAFDSETVNKIAGAVGKSAAVITIFSNPALGISLLALNHMAEKAANKKNDDNNGPQGPGME